MSIDSLGAKTALTVGDQSVEMFALGAVDGAKRLPYSLKVLLENLLRTEDGVNITADHIRAVAAWDPAAEPVDGNPVHARARDHAGLHRSALRRRPRHDA